ncbi:MAG TPA: ABC transporter permease [Streptosporangiaceae bacterium]|nr:ABC transporter permease [Streptosporangiaceae bacterium]
MSSIRMGETPLRVIPPVAVTRPWRSVAGSGSIHIIERHARAYRHMWLMLASGVAEPLFYLFSLGVGLGHLVGPVTGPGGEKVTFVAFVAPALLANATMQGAITDSTFNVYFLLKFAKAYDAALATPMGPTDVTLGQIAWAVIRAAMYAVAFMLVMAAVGLLRTPWAALELAVVVLTGFAFAAVGMAATTFMRSWQDFEYITLLTMPLFLFSATFYPLSVYPRWLQFVVEWTPLYQAVTLMRGLALGVVGPGLLWHVAYLGAMGVAGLFVAGRRVRRLLLK